MSELREVARELLRAYISNLVSQGQQYDVIYEKVREWDMIINGEKF